MSTPALSPQHVPDILDCLAQLSNDEVPTPPKLASAMLDLLPDEVWSNADYRWLDPFCKSGVFLREAARRLLEGLSNWEPDFEKRRGHIYREMLWGTSITEMTGHIARRSLYYSRDASGECSVIPFDTAGGNLPFVPAEHSFAKGRCTTCGAPEGLERGDTRENYAYSFIHGAYPTEEMPDMKFDVIVGNPPYQIGMTDVDGNKTANILPLYQRFVERAIGLNPRYVLMITPSRWFSGGKGLDEFRDRMINDRRLRVIVDNPKIYDCFPGVKIRGGVSYFLWDREHDGDVEFSSRVDGKLVSSAVRDIREGDGVLVRDNLAAAIVHRVREKMAASLETEVRSQDPFGQTLKTNYKGAAATPFGGAVPLIFGTKVGYVKPDQLERNHEWVDRWKVLLPMASSGDTALDDLGRIIDVVLGEPIALAPGSACTQTYLVAGLLDSKKEAENYAHYLATKFVRFLILQRKTTQHLRPDRFRFVPSLDMARRWTDEDLYEEFSLTAEQRKYIEDSIKPRTVNLSLESPIPPSHLPGGAKFRVGPEPEDRDDSE